jgi:hypothetical protein
MALVLWESRLLFGLATGERVRHAVPGPVPVVGRALGHLGLRFDDDGGALTTTEQVLNDIWRSLPLDAGRDRTVEYIDHVPVEVAPYAIVTACELAVGDIVFSGTRQATVLGEAASRVVTDAGLWPVLAVRKCGESLAATVRNVGGAPSSAAEGRERPCV